MTPDPSFWLGRRVLLTGHTGFMGSWLALWLLELGAHVTGLALPQETEPSLFAQLELDQRLDHRIGDIRDPALLSELVSETRPELVLHLAAQPLVRRSYAEPTATWATNVMGTIHLLEALRRLQEPCTAVLITTDKVYRNNEWLYGYRENDPLGGHDPYCSSKAAAELAIASWRSSFCGFLPHQSPHLRIASARAGNVIGGGDWAEDRIVQDAMRALAMGEPIGVRNPTATRPWQHVLEPLGGYLLLAERLRADPSLADAFNSDPRWRPSAACVSWWSRPCATGPEAGSTERSQRPPRGQPAQPGNRQGPPPAGLEPPLGFHHHRGAHRGLVPAGAPRAGVSPGLLPGGSGGVLSR
ncbi:MAG: CDP-glucose 4,6-dehydratase [Synechococcaceae cyanobacterium ELA739]